ncbi:MAG: DinB family protein [Phycisphaerales bacterium]
MNAGDPTGVLLAHDRWATLNVLDACAALSDEQLQRRFEIGCGSLHDNVVHMIGAMRVWADVLGRRAPRPWIDEAPRRSVAELISMVKEAADDLAACARMGPMDEVLKRERQGVVHEYTRATVVTHVTTHGMHHRAQCINMLRHLGVKQLPQSSVVEWSRAGCP